MSLGKWFAAGLVFVFAAVDAHAGWCDPCSAAITIETSFQRVSAIARCGYCMSSTGIDDVNVNVAGSLSLVPDGSPDVCSGNGRCGMSSYADPLRASTDYTATGSFTASQLWLTISTTTVTDTRRSADPAVPPGGTETQDKCDGPTGFGQPCSPILINLSDGPWALSGSNDPVLFDIDGDGTRNRITWTGRGEPLAFVALDRNENGTIDSGVELFGNATRLRSGARAINGFEALREFDDNGDGLVDATDHVWPALLLWADSDHDGVSQSSEIRSLADSDIAWLGTDYETLFKRDAHNNTFQYMSHVGVHKGKRPYYDVYFQPVR